MANKSTQPIALTIAGSDSGGGAGVQADLKTFTALDVFGTSVVTVVTAQNTREVTDLEPVSKSLVREEYTAVMSDFEVEAAKTGALGNAANIDALCACLAERPVDNLVVDPVMVSKHGDPLLPPEGQKAIKRRLLDYATVATPNKYEAEILAGMDVGDLESMKRAAEKILDLGPESVVLKGSHFDDTVVDLYMDAETTIQFSAEKIDTDSLHGSGCVFSSAITAGLAKGDSLRGAIESARGFISSAIREAPKVGNGIAPVNPIFESR